MSHELLTFLLPEMVLGTKLITAPHPPWWGRMIRRFLVSTFPIAQHILFDLTVTGLDNFTNSKGTLIVVNHKTDFDIILLGPTMYKAGGKAAKRIAFVAAERMFLPGYISDYILHGPQWLRRLVYPANLSAILKAIRAYPIGYLNSRKLKAHLRTTLEIIGDMPIGEVFSRPIEEVIPGATANTPISRILRFRYHEALDQDWDFSLFTPTIRHKLRRQHMQETLENLSRFAAVLDDGDPLYIAPEGGLESDGRFDEAKAGLVRLVRMARDAIILPVNITYDFMTIGKQRAFMTIGKEQRDVKDWSRSRLERNVITSVERLGTITFSQLAALGMRRLAKQGDLVHTVALKQEILRQALLLTDRGYYVDMHTLEPREFARRWKRFIAYCLSNRMLRQIGAWLMGDMRALFEPTSDGRVSPWAYAVNEFDGITRATEAGIVETEPEKTVVSTI